MEETGWQIGDILTIIIIISSVIVTSIAWMIRFELKLAKMESKIDANTQMDKQMANTFTEKIGDVLLQITKLTEEVHAIREWITAQKAIEEDRRNRS